MSKLTTLAVSLFASILVTIPAQAALVANGIAGANLQGYWQFDEANSASPPLANPTPDQSGNSRSGTYQAALGRATDGTFSPNILGSGNKVIRPTGVTNKEVLVASPSPISAFGIGSSYSASFWFNVDSGAQNAPVFLCLYSVTNGGWRIGYNHITSGSNLRLFVGQKNGASAEQFIFVDGLATPGSWQFLTYTYNASTSAAALYLNGNTTPIASGTLNAPSNSSDSLRISGLNGSSYLAGFMDEVAIWNSNLSASQVNALYLSYLPEPASMSLLLAGVCLIAGRCRRAA